MKASVAFLEPHMEIKADSNGKGKVLLATVKGDVHDIGKNLVDIILSNNGYKVIDLGIKVTPQTLITAIQDEKPDIVGLSGLLVKSAQQMVVTAQDLHQAGISTPILVGGAALSRKFTNNKIAHEYSGPVLYAKDAMDGLSLANRLQNKESFDEIITELEQKRSAQQADVISEPIKKDHSVAVMNRSTVSTTVKVFKPADLKRHLLRNITIAQIEPYINMQMLLGHHLGLKGKVDQLLETKDEKAVFLKDTVDKLLTKVKNEELITPSAVYQFFPAQSDGESVIIYDPNDEKKVIKKFTFPRQQKGSYLCLADYLKPVSSGEMDYVGFFAVTAGKGIRALAKRFKDDGDFLQSHAIQALALELAEGFAERVHQLMRDQLGFPDGPDFTMKDRFSAKYQGQRFSFGYPACPDLDDQEKLFELLKPEDIGIQLTDGFMMEPEASVSAIVFAHPEARYFNVL